MSAQREGFFGDILDKVKDIVTDNDERKEDRPAENPPVVEPKCCGPVPKFVPTMDGHGVTTEEPVEHDAGCPNHPDNLAAEVAS